MEKKVEEYIELYPVLAEATNKDGFQGLDIASLPNKVAIWIRSDCSIQFLAQNDYQLWFYILEINDMDGVENRVMQSVQMYPELANVTDCNGRSAMEAATPANKAAIVMGSPEMISAVLLGNYELWFYLLQSSNFSGLPAKLAEYVKVFPQLAHAKDASGRLALDVATHENREAIKAVFYLHGRYELLEDRPIHTSAKNFIYRALDDKRRDEHGEPRKVALKLMTSKMEFLREIEARKQDFDKSFVVPILSTIPSNIVDLRNFPDEIDVDESIFEEGPTKEFAEQLFCITMPWAERNLFVAMKHDRFAGTASLDEARDVFMQIVRCVEHIHSKDMVHGDLKPTNILREESQWKLTDLDSCVRIGSDALKHKFSTAYLPPEAIFADPGMDIATARSSSALHGGDIYGDSFYAQISTDIWALGCILYQLCNADVMPLFVGNRDDNLPSWRSIEDNLWALADWSEAKKHQKLARISDQLAKNLLSQMLSRIPAQRPGLLRILDHPFLSSKSVTRLIGQMPMYDVYLSYRHKTDSSHARILYNHLTGLGLTVWWDRQALAPGEPWISCFYKGLINCRVCVCLLSKSAIASSDDPTLNFSLLGADSPLDNLLLEYRVALEFVDAGLIECIYPVRIGDMDAANSGSYSKLFSSGVVPRAPNVVVKSVEEQMRFCLEKEALGPPLKPDRQASSVLAAVNSAPGFNVEGDGDIAFPAAAADIAKAVMELKQNEEVAASARSMASAKSMDHPQAQQLSLNLDNVGFSGKSTDLNLYGPLAALKSSLMSDKQASTVTLGGGRKSQQMHRELSAQKEEIIKLKEQLQSTSAIVAAAAVAAAQGSSPTTMIVRGESPPVTPDLKDRPPSSAAGSALVSSLRSEIVRLQSQIRDRDETIRLLREKALEMTAREAEISANQVPTKGELRLLKEQVALLGSLEQEMRCLSDKNRQLRRDSAREIRQLREQLAAQVEENWQLQRTINQLSGGVHAVSPSSRSTARTATASNSDDVKGFEE